VVTVQSPQTTHNTVTNYHHTVIRNLAFSRILRYPVAMTIEQTVEIPVDHRLTVEVPPEIPSGRIRLELKFTPEYEPQKTAPGAWINPLKGLCKGSKLTLERFKEMQRADSKLENEIDQRLRASNK
jgi:hypothetical protein